MQQSLHLISGLIITVLLSSCTSISTMQQRTLAVEQIVSARGWQSQIIATSFFDLMSYRPALHQSKHLTVYIEGDGLAWLTSRQVSANPTPTNPLVLKMALKDASNSSIYIARPCQYVTGKHIKNCNKKYWTSHRFSTVVIEAMNDAITQLKHSFQAKEFTLVGYSGGGAIATLVAARRDDVVKLITVAGNLDHQAWTDYHNISPLTGSLNPADYQASLSAIEQIHFVGENDKIIPPFLAQLFVDELPANSKSKVIVVPGQTHSYCWDDVWPELLSIIE